MESPTWNLLWEAQSLYMLVSLAGGTTHPFEPPTWNSREATERHWRPQTMAKRSTRREEVEVELMIMEEHEEAIGKYQQDENECKSMW